MTDLELHPDFTPAPTTLFPGLKPAQIVAQATAIADVIAPLIRERNLYKRIGQSDHVYLDGWTLAGTMLGVFPITVASGPVVVGAVVVGYQATVEARTMAGQVVGRADAECTRDENEKWEKAPSFQLRSMAQTRASSKALRLPLSFVMRLAGYDATPAEEMEAAAARGETVSGGRGVRPGWRDIQEQNTAHQRLNVFVANSGLGEWVAVWLDSKGYTRPLSKGQMAELRRAVDRELEDRRQEKSDPGKALAPPGTDPGSGPTSEAREDSTPRVTSHPASDAQSPEPNAATRASAGSGVQTPSPSPSLEDEGRSGRGQGARAEGKRHERTPDAPAGPHQEPLQ